jgi:hypothetical protein
MPTVARINGFRFYFYSHEPNEPPHVDRAGASAKFWLDPVALARAVGYKPQELTALLALVRQHRETFLEAWHAFFAVQGR